MLYAFLVHEYNFIVKVLPCCSRGMAFRARMDNAFTHVLPVEIARNVIFSNLRTRSCQRQRNGPAQKTEKSIDQNIHTNNITKGKAEVKIWATVE